MLHPACQREDTAYDRRVRSFLTVVVLTVVTELAACTDDGSGFAGDYEVTSGGGAGAFFRLADADGLVAYYPCTALGACDDLYDFARSFGRSHTDGFAYAGYIATAIPRPDGCALAYRVHGLRAGIEIVDITYGETAQSECTSDAAAARGEAMPQLDSTTVQAERR